MVFDNNIVLDQRLRVDDAIPSDGGLGIDDCLVHDDRSLSKFSPA